MNAEQPGPATNEHGQYVDTEGRPVGEVAAKFQAENKRATDYLNNEDPNAAINTQYPSAEEAQKSMEQNEAGSREHLEKNLGAYVAQAQSDMDQDLEARGPGNHEDAEPGAKNGDNSGESQK